MLCKFCQQTIFASRRRWGLHRKDYRDVDKDPELEKCTVCSHLGKNVDVDCAYRWTIRWLSATREDQKCMLITFRQSDNHLSGPQAENHGDTSHSTGHFKGSVAFYLLQKGMSPPSSIKTPR